MALVGALDLLLLVPLSLLGAQAIVDLANRRVSVRSLIISGASNCDVNRMVGKCGPERGPR